MPKKKSMKRGAAHHWHKAEEDKVAPKPYVPTFIPYIGYNMLAVIFNVYDIFIKANDDIYGVVLSVERRLSLKT